MKCFFLLLIFGCLGCTQNLQAQNFTYKPGVSSPLVDFDFTVKDTSNNHIFKNHPEIDRIVLRFTNRQSLFIYVNDSPHDRSIYDMEYKGDSLAFNHRYGSIHFDLPRISSLKLYGREKLDFPTHWDIRTSIVTDSMVYAVHYWSGENSPFHPADGMAGGFLGSYERLGQEIADALRLENLTIIADSVIVVQGVLGKEGENSLTDLQLVVGEQSVFSDIAMRVLGSDRNKWHPATFRSGARGRSINRFYIQLNNDGTVLISAPKYMDAIFG